MSFKSAIGAALLAGAAGALASVYFEPTIAYRLASTEVGQRVLSAALDANAPAPPVGIKIAERDGIVPAMTLTSLDGAHVKIPQAWAGRITLVNLWASWCAPCLKEMPELQRFAKTHGTTGVQVVGIALDDADAARAILQRIDIHYPILLDAPGPTDAGVRLGNIAGVLPYTVLVASDGRVLKTRIGPFTDTAEIAAWSQL